jgi:hypothetical protein
MAFLYGKTVAASMVNPADLVLVMNRSSNLAGKSYDFLMKKPDEKTEYGA